MISLVIYSIKSVKYNIHYSDRLDILVSSTSLCHRFCVFVVVILDNQMLQSLPAEIKKF